MHFNSNSILPAICNAERNVKQVSENLGAPMVGLSMWVALRRSARCARSKGMIHLS